MYHVILKIYLNNKEFHNTLISVLIQKHLTVMHLVVLPSAMCATMLMSIGRSQKNAILALTTLL